MSDPPDSATQFCGQCGRAAGADQRFCRACGAALDADTDVASAAATIRPQELHGTHAAADRAGFPRWGWAIAAAVVAVVVAAVGGFAIMSSQSSDGGGPMAAATSPSTSTSAPAPSQSPSTHKATPKPTRTVAPTPALRAIPVGWTLWKSKDGGSVDAIAVRRIGTTVSLAFNGVPCFTGESTGGSTYKGGGLNQQGTYSKQTWTVKMIDATHLSTSTDDFAATYQLVSDNDRVKTYSGVLTLSDLQQGC